MRVLIQIILPLLVPIVTYAIWSYWDSKRKGTTMPSWQDGHWFWVVIAGVILAIASLAFFTTMGAEPNSEYVPPRMENGRLIPGHHK